MPKILPSLPLPAPPSKGTLRSYGLTAEDWYDMCRRQGCVCPVCKKEFGDRKLAIDHAHVKGWRARKAKLKSGRVRAAKDQRVMTPEQRRPHVRGILHMWCNGLVRTWLTRERAESILAYLIAHEDRKGTAPRNVK